MKLAPLFLAVGLAAIGARAGLTLFAGDELRGSNEHTSYHAGGERKEWAEYLDGKRHGACRRWYPGGELRAEGTYVEGRMHGRWTWYAEDGSVELARSGAYEDGRRVSD